MKPTKNRVFCMNAERVKMLFESEKHANNFIKFNKTEMDNCPVRSYYCVFCNGWHLTSFKTPANSHKELLLKKLNNKTSSIKSISHTPILYNNELIEKIQKKLKYVYDNKDKFIFLSKVINRIKLINEIEDKGKILNTLYHIRKELDVKKITKEETENNKWLNWYNNLKVNNNGNKL